MKVYRSDVSVVSGVDDSGVDDSGADDSGADVSGAYDSSADHSGADCSDAYYSGVPPVGLTFETPNKTGAVLHKIAPTIMVNTSSTPIYEPLYVSE